MNNRLVRLGSAILLLSGIIAHPRPDDFFPIKAQNWWKYRWVHTRPACDVGDGFGRWEGFLVIRIESIEARGDSLEGTSVVFKNTTTVHRENSMFIDTLYEPPLELVAFDTVVDSGNSISGWGLYPPMPHSPHEPWLDVVPVDEGGSRHYWRQGTYRYFDGWDVYDTAYSRAGTSRQALLFLDDYGRPLVTLENNTGPVYLTEWGWWQCEDPQRSALVETNAGPYTYADGEFPFDTSELAVPVRQSRTRTGREPVRVSMRGATLSIQPGALPQPCSVVISDARGRRIMRLSGPETRSGTIDLSRHRIAAGTYLVTIAARGVPMSRAFVFARGR